jgi:glyoxylase-like metal-dependent hydrolase (beta-lactamase superfamily II)
MKITNRVYLVGGSGFGYSAAGDCNIYLVDGGSKQALVDTGGGRGIPDILTNVERMGFDSKDIEIAFLTHCHYDHIGGNKALKEAVRCKFVAHEDEKDAIETLNEMTLYSMGQRSGLEFEPISVDLAVKDGDEVALGEISVKVLHTPGHTPGGISFILEDEGKVNLFPGDSASAQGRLGFVNGPGFNMENWKNSIKKMLSCAPDMLFPGHGTFAYSRAVDCLALLDRKWNSPWTNIITASG